MPCSLDTAVSKLPASGGYTVCLTEGANKTYNRKFTLTKGGAIANTIRSCDASGSPAIIVPINSNITNATNASPIVITAANHSLATGNSVVIFGVGGNTAANGTWTVTVTDANTFSLNSSTGNGAYTSGGLASKNNGWARFEGYQHSTLGASIGAHTAFATITIVLASDVAFAEGATIWIGGEQFRLAGKQPDNVTWNNSQGGWGGTSTTTHSVGETVYSPDNVLTVSALNLTLRDFEVLDSYLIRMYDLNFNNTTIPIRSGGIIVQNCTGVKLINLVVHDTSTGIFANESAIGLEIYGVIVFNNGFVDWSRGHGQGFYLANEPAQQKKIRNVISFNGFSDAMKAYTSSGKAQNFLFEHVIAFNPGVSSTFPGNHGAGGSDIPANYRDSAIFVGANGTFKNTDNVLIHDSYLYQSFNTEGALLWTGYFKNVGSLGLEVTNSRIMGGSKPFSVAYKTLTVTGNKFYAQAAAPAGNGKVLVQADLDNGYSGTWNNNTYYDLTPDYPFPVASFPFILTVGGAPKQACVGGGVIKFTDPNCAPNGGFKQHTGFDAGSTSVRAAPTGTEAFPIKNEYDPTSAHVAIFNWALNSTVTVDPNANGTILSPGDIYAIYAAENYLGSAIQTGTYTGSPIAFSMAAGTVATPIGLSWVAPSTRPQFGAYVIRKQ